VNILLVSRDFLFQGGAAARWSSLTKYWSEWHTIFVLTDVRRKIPEHHVMNDGIQILRIPLKTRLTTIPFVSLFNVVFLVFYLRTLLARINIDVVIVTIPELEEGIACAIACKKYKKNFIIDIRDLIIEDHVKFVYSMFPKTFQKVVQQFLFRSFVRFVNSSSRVVTVTLTLKQILQSDGIKVPVDVVPNGADTTLFHALSHKRKLVVKNEMGLEKNFLILYAGALDVEYYPMDVIYRAFKIVAQSMPNAKLILCGSGNKELLQNLGKNIQYLGVLKREEVAKIMQVSDIGVISMDDRKSTFCALTTKFFEYLGSGLPVVAACPRGGELDRLISSKKVGYAVPPGDHESMANKILRLLSCTEEHQIFARNGIKLVSAEFNRRKLAESYSEILSDIKKLKR